MKVCGMPLLDGWARKVGLVAISTSLIGWLIFVICFGNFNNGDNFYNDVRENKVVRIRKEALERSDVPIPLQFLASLVEGDYVDVPVNDPGQELISSQGIEEDFPENRADGDFVTFYWFAVVYPIAALLTVAHLILHGVPVLGFIISLAAHLLLALSLVCGAGTFWAEGNRLFSADNNFRDDFNGRAAPVEAVPEDWRMDPYWGAWLLGEWVGLLITGILVIVYYTISPFFINHGRLFRKLNESYEMEEK